MTISAGTVSLGVKPDTGGFGSSLASSLNKETAGLAGIGKALGSTLLGGVGIALAGVGAILHTGIGEAMDASAGNAQLAAGIKSTSNAAGVSVDSLNAMASSIQNMSGQTDDSISASQKLLLTFTNIKNNGVDKIFDQATLASANMAAKMGGDAAGSAVLLGKALNDPIKGISALSRVGVSFTDSQKAAIQSMVDMGDTAGAQKIILGELNTEFGGAAEAAGNSLPGQIEKGKRAFEDLSQTVVEVLLPAVMPAITNISQVIKDATPGIKEFAEAFSQHVNQAVKDAAPTIEVVKDVVGKLAAIVTTQVVPALMSFGGWLKDNKDMLFGLGAVVAGGVIAFQAYSAVMGVVRLATVAWAVVQGVLNGTLIANPIGLIIVAIGALVAGIIWVATKTTFFQDVWKAMTTGIGAAWTWVWNSVIKPVADWIGSAIHTIGDVIGTVFGAIGGVVSGAFRGVVSFIKGYINTIIDIVNGVIGTINGIGGAVKAATGGAIDITLGKIPKLAEGGIVPATPGGRLVRVAEAGQDEAVIPLSKLSAMGGGGGVHVSVVNKAGVSLAELIDLHIETASGKRKIDLSTGMQQAAY